MSDGWLFQLRTTLGARHAVPAWPAAGSRTEPRSAATSERAPTAPAAARAPEYGAELNPPVCDSDE
jgi:hypothetical protein